MDHSRYYELGQPEDDRERTEYFLLDALLRSRVACGFESKADSRDEEVNVYLVDLLSKLVGAPGLGAVAADRDIDVFAQVQDSMDPRFKSLVYRVNADHLLLTSSLFTSMPAHRDRHGRRRIGRGKAYYHYASMFQERLRAGSPAFAQVLHLLSCDFEGYVDVLFHMRAEYFHLYERLTDADLPQPLDPAEATAEAAAPGSMASLRDRFLDAYGAWQRSGDAASLRALEEAAARLSAADPDFDADQDFGHPQ
ncbi:hypothetical protein K8I85_13980 [bacterium]|nr:hypothetical protein [bacterium]